MLLFPRLPCPTDLITEMVSVSRICFQRAESPQVKRGICWEDPGVARRNLPLTLASGKTLLPVTRRKKGSSDWPDTGLYRVKFMSGQDYWGVGTVKWGGLGFFFRLVGLRSSSASPDIPMEATGTWKSPNKIQDGWLRAPSKPSALTMFCNPAFINEVWTGIDRALYWVIKPFFLPIGKWVLVCMPHLLEPGGLSPWIAFSETWTHSKTVSISDHELRDLFIAHIWQEELRPEVHHKCWRNIGSKKKIFLWTLKLVCFCNQIHKSF